MSASVLLLLLGCPRRPATTPVGEGGPPAPEPSPRTAVIGPQYWAEDGGLCLDVPEGWTGTAGPPPLLLEIGRPDGDFRLEVRAWEGAAAPPAERAGFVLLFEDEGSYRSVPILARAASRSWASVEPDGPMAFAWYGPLHGRTVEVTALVPAGRATEGLAILEPLLDALCTTRL